MLSHSRESTQNLLSNFETVGDVDELFQLSIRNGDVDLMKKIYKLGPTDVDGAMEVAKNVKNFKAIVFLGRQYPSLIEKVVLFLNDLLQKQDYVEVEHFIGIDDHVSPSRLIGKFVSMTLHYPQGVDTRNVSKYIEHEDTLRNYINSNATEIFYRAASEFMKIQNSTEHFPVLLKNVSLWWNYLLEKGVDFQVIYDRQKDFVQNVFKSRHHLLAEIILIHSTPHIPQPVIVRSPDTFILLLLSGIVEPDTVVSELDQFYDAFSVIQMLFGGTPQVDGEIRDFVLSGGTSALSKRVCQIGWIVQSGLYKKLESDFLPKRMSHLLERCRRLNPDMDLFFDETNEDAAVQVAASKQRAQIIARLRNTNIQRRFNEVCHEYERADYQRQLSDVMSSVIKRKRSD